VKENDSFLEQSGRNFEKGEAWYMGFHRRPYLNTSVKKRLNVDIPCNILSGDYEIHYQFMEGLLNLAETGMISLLQWNKKSMAQLLWLGNN
jgi:hypothetical protein